MQNKAQYIKFFHLIEPHLNVGGYIACDNVISHASKVQTFLEDINANPNYENVVLPLPAGLSLAKNLGKSVCHSEAVIYEILRFAQNDFKPKNLIKLGENDE